MRRGPLSHDGDGKPGHWISIRDPLGLVATIQPEYYGNQQEALEMADSIVESFNERWRIRQCVERAEQESLRETLDGHIEVRTFGRRAQ